MDIQDYTKNPLEKKREMPQQVLRSKRCPRGSHNVTPKSSKSKYKTCLKNSKKVQKKSRSPCTHLTTKSACTQSGECRFTKTGKCLKKPAGKVYLAPSKYDHMDQHIEEI